MVDGQYFCHSKAQIGFSDSGRSDRRSKSRGVRLGALDVYGDSAEFG